MISIRLGWLVLFSVTCSSLPVFAADPASVNLENYELRMDFIESRLAENRQYASYWQNGWSTFYAASAVAQTALWINADNHDERVNYGIGTAKAVGGLADMLMRPHPGRHGVAPFLDSPQATPEQKRAKLEQGETTLMNSADRSASRRSWQPHLKVVGVNLIAGALIAAFGDTGDALTSTAIGVAIGEANIWTLPTKPEADWNEYQQKFPESGSMKKSDWRIVPITGGLALQMNF